MMKLAVLAGQAGGIFAWWVPTGDWVHPVYIAMWEVIPLLIVAHLIDRRNKR